MLLNKALDGGVNKALCYLGKIYEDGIGVAVDTDKAFEYYKKASDLNVLEAYPLLGNLYVFHEGYGSEGEAFELFMKSKNLPESKRLLGFCYENGIGTDEDAYKATEWYKSAAEDGDVIAQYNLAECYRTGSGAVKDTNLVAYWYKRAARQGDTDSIEALERYFENL